jgi:hypothetical protein
MCAAAATVHNHVPHPVPIYPLRWAKKKAGADNPGTYDTQRFEFFSNGDIYRDARKFYKDYVKAIIDRYK